MKNQITQFLLLLILIGSNIKLSAQQAASEASMITVPVFGGDELTLQKFLTDQLKDKNAGSVTGKSPVFRMRLMVTKTNEIKNLKVIDSLSNNTQNKNINDAIIRSNLYWKSGFLKSTAIDLNIILTIKFQSGSNIISSATFDVERDNLLANNFYNEGASLAQNSKFEEALKFLNETVAIMPGDIDALYNRGICHLKTNNIPAACSDWKKVAQMGSEDANSFILKYCGEPAKN
ncbi:MAG: tetratricopeptide repeat protein [Bacteroidetes bacterium]|nr:tetratricopeptide repeat protein [Bacteroidota bacterium]MBK7968735.1 tetratricopeptide repeat protein [Bacteroidota bacterium]MBK9045509.1 tetratricopeptide repeat protein [Bacteroidota bacterium]MBK9423761.1 tetratricopeptide repeat protein [Bacteroidota bacterium]MBL0072658.1 tetratricopeptide repeat protein [Bacteroidota bacterium]